MQYSAHKVGFNKQYY